MSEKFILFDTGPDGVSQGFVDPIRLIIAWEPDEVADAFAAMDAAKTEGKWLAGYFSYELGYILEPALRDLLPDDRGAPLILMGVFDGPDMSATRGLLHRARAEAADTTIAPPTPLWSKAEHANAIARVKDYIGAGDFYQTNLTFPMETTYSGSPLGLYASLRQGQRVRHGGVVHLGVGPNLVSRSPELFFQLDADRNISTRPMKGTAPRGDTIKKDAELKAFLAGDEKNRAENLMIVDLLRNDMCRVAELGSVKVPELFSVETYATVHQMTSLVTAKLRPDLSLLDLFSALFPCGSITGAPKIRAMQAIDELEIGARDAYCGSIGWIAPTGEMAFNVAIRTLALGEHGSVRLNVGGGIVWDSTAQDEYTEALWKARFTKIIRPN